MPDINSEIIPERSIQAAPKIEFKLNADDSGVEVKRPFFQETHIIQLNPPEHLKSALQGLYGKGWVYHISSTQANTLEQTIKPDSHIYILDRQPEKTSVFIPYSQARPLLQQPSLSFLAEELEHVHDFQQERQLFTQNESVNARVKQLARELSDHIPTDYSPSELESIVRKHEGTHSVQQTRFNIHGFFELKNWVDRNHMADKISDTDYVDYDGLDYEVRALAELQSFLAEIRNHGATPQHTVVTDLERKAVRLNAAKALYCLYGYKELSEDLDFRKSFIEGATRKMNMNQRGTVSAQPHNDAWILLMLGPEYLGEDAYYASAKKPLDAESLGEKMLAYIELATYNPDEFIRKVATTEFAKKVDLKLIKTLKELERSFDDIHKKVILGG